MPNGTWGTAPMFKRDFSAQVATEHYYHLDHLGTPQRLSNQAGEITWRAYSEAFGKITIDQTVAPTTTAATTNNLMFPGQYEDAEAATRYNYYRDYDPETGRYVQSDPIGLNGGINTYAYVGGDPLSLVDVYGLCSCKREDATKEYPGPGGGQGIKKKTWFGLSTQTTITVSCKYKCTKSDGSTEVVRGSETIVFSGEEVGDEKSCIGDQYQEQYQSEWGKSGKFIKVYKNSVSFDPRGANSPELKIWASKPCNCK